MAGQIINRGRDSKTGQTIWLIRVFLGRDVTGKRQYLNHTFHGTKKAAQNWLNQRLTERDSGELATKREQRAVTVQDILDLVLADYQKHGRDVSWPEYVIRKRLVPFFEGYRALDVTTQAINAYIESRKAAGEANATINRALAVLRRGFNLSRRTDPPMLDKVPHIESLKENNIRKGFFEHHEYLALRDALPEYLAPVLAFGYYTGCRRGEILSLEWSQVDLINRTVRLEPGTTKNREGRVIPLAGELLQILSILRQKRDSLYPACRWVFTYDGEKPIRDFRDSWKKASFRAKLWDGGDEATGKPTRLFHDLRRTGVRNLVRAGVPEKIAMAISGHKTRAVFDRYDIVNEADLKNAMGRLDSYLEQRDAAHKADTESAWHTIGTHGSTAKPS
jgi:integrase